VFRLRSGRANDTPLIARRAVLLGLVLLVGINLRTVLLGIPPILPLIQRDLGLSHTGVGFLTALPVLIMGAGAWPAGMLVNRAGARRTVALGLLVLAGGGVLRAVWPGAFPLYCFTAVLSVGIAFAQTAIVALVRIWFPSHIGLASALYTDGIISGEALGAGLTLPLLLHLLGRDAWRASLVAWSLPVLAVLVTWLILAPKDSAPAQVLVPPMPGRGPVRSAGSFGGRPMWLMATHLGLLSGCGSLIYFTMNAWTAPYNAALGQGTTTALSLAVLNAAQLPVSLAITPAAQRLIGRRAPFMVSGVLCLVAMGGWAWTPASLQPIWAALSGGSTVAVLLLGIALPPYFATRATVAKLVGATLSVSYFLSFTGQVVGGRLWDLGGRPIYAFLPVIAASFALILLGALLPAKPTDATDRTEVGIPQGVRTGASSRSC
jgi:CP family cyanate transporter-like MFS transporter